MAKRTHTLRLLWRSKSGNATLELVICTPLLLLLLLGAVEVTRFILITQKLEKVAVTLSDVATQSETLSTAELNQIVTAAAQVMQPYTFSSNGYVIMSSVTKNGSSNPVINWQYQGGGTWTQSSRVGISGTSATLPAGFTMDDKENVIVSEVFYNFVPLFGSKVFPASFTVYKTGYFRPRLGSLTTLSSLRIKYPAGAVL